MWSLFFWLRGMCWRLLVTMGDLVEPNWVRMIALDDRERLVSVVLPDASHPLINIGGVNI